MSSLVMLSFTLFPQLFKANHFILFHKISKIGDGNMSEARGSPMKTINSCD